MSCLRAITGHLQLLVQVVDLHHPHPLPLRHRGALRRLSPVLPLQST